MKDRGNRLLRILDRWFGIPLIFFLGLFRLRKRPLPREITSIALLVTAAIGDTILISALVREIQERYPQASLTLFCGNTNAAMARLSCPLGKIVEIPVGNPLKAIARIRSEHRGHQRGKAYQVWIDTGPWPRINSLISFFSPSLCRIGYKSPGQSRHFIYDILAEHRSDRHEMDNIRSLGKALDIAGNSLPRLNFLYDRVEKKDFIAVHIFPGGYLSHFKEWAEEKWIELIDELTQKGYSVNLTGAPPDRERALSIRERCQKKDLIVVSAGETNLHDTGAILYQSRAVISVNTGIMHYAAALSVPLVALHGPTSVLRWGPLSDQALSLESSSPGSGILHLGFEYNPRYPDAMNSIEVPSVLKALDRLLNKENED